MAVKPMLYLINTIYRVSVQDGCKTMLYLIKTIYSHYIFYKGLPWVQHDTTEASHFFLSLVLLKKIIEISCTSDHFSYITYMRGPTQCLNFSIFAIRLRC